MNLIIIAGMILGILGFTFGMLLAFSARKFAVKMDPRVSSIMGALPGVNCGACGYPGCPGYAEAIVHDGASVNKCTVGGHETAEAIGKIMGKDAGGAKKFVAFVKCRGDKQNCPDSSKYKGINDCEAVALMGMGYKSCRYGCFGLGNCVTVCPFDAIIIEKHSNIPKVLVEKCTGCGLCASACPRHIIEIVPGDKTVHIACLSKDKGADVRKICKVGCIACSICVKICPQNAITIIDNCAQINYELCNDCGLCAQKCPTKSIAHTKALSLF
ncbi:MAG: RnfABCDGE type electron transport complex subunit B [Elusimicrobiota bacterium]